MAHEPKANDWKVIEKQASGRKTVYVVEHIDTGEVERVAAKRSLEVGEHLAEADFTRINAEV
ncbi:MAG TPA: hypothetical protein VEB64_18010 [Azospirillaceae bacterium]|nr:hypothetical protein [Azospirillaceae bacterium]